MLEAKFFCAQAQVKAAVKEAQAIWSWYKPPIIGGDGRNTIIWGGSRSVMATMGMLAHSGNSAFIKGKQITEDEIKTRLRERGISDVNLQDDD